MLIDDLSVTAFDADLTPSKKNQKFINALKERLDNIDEYSTGFTVPMSLNDIICQVGRNILTSDNSAAALFLQLNEDYTVDRIKAFDCDRVFFENMHLPPMYSTGQTIPVIFKDGNKIRDIPYIYFNGHKISLDCINFLWQPLDADAEAIVGNNPLRPGIRTSFTKMEFLENLRKVLKNQAWPKVKIVLDEKAVIQDAPAEVRQNPKLVIKYLNDYLQTVEDQFTGIKADQNLIFYNTVSDIGFLESKQKFDPRPVAELINSELISSYKAPPSTVGQGGKSKVGEGLASAELVIFRRSIKALRKVIERVFSRAFTLALRLDGRKGYAVFKMNEFSLRPPLENAQFETIAQENIIQAWEAGAIGDKEKNRKIRDLNKLEGDAPPDASVKEFSDKRNMQAERTPISEEKKETKRRETRRDQKTGNNRKSD